jgi:hypothetical protein
MRPKRVLVNDQPVLASNSEAIKLYKFCHKFRVLVQFQNPSLRTAGEAIQRPFYAS